MRTGEPLGPRKLLAVRVSMVSDEAFTDEELSAAINRLALGFFRVRLQLPDVFLSTNCTLQLCSYRCVIGALRRTCRPQCLRLRHLSCCQLCNAQRPARRPPLMLQEQFQPLPLLLFQLRPAQAV